MNNLNSLLWNSSACFKDLIVLIKSKNDIEITGIASIAVPSFLKALRDENLNIPILFITSQESNNFLHKISNQLKRLECESDIFPSAQVSLWEGLQESENHFAKITNILRNWTNQINSFTICSTKSLSQPVMPLDKFKNKQIILQKKQNINLTSLLNELIILGYKRVDTVFDIGCFALRGDILDIFCEVDKLPFRINLFDNEIESIKSFEPWTQRSNRMQDLNEIIICPLRPFVFSLADEFDKLYKLSSELEETQIEFWRQDLANDEWQRFIPWLDENLISPLEYFPQKGLIIVEEPLSIIASLQRIKEYLLSDLEHKLQRKYLPNSQKMPLSKIANIPEVVLELMKNYKVLKLVS